MTAMAGAVVEVGKMFGLSETTNGSKGSGFTSTKDGVGVSATPHMEMEADGAPQLVVKRTSRRIKHILRFLSVRLIVKQGRFYIEPLPTSANYHDRRLSR